MSFSLEHLAVKPSQISLPSQIMAIGKYGCGKSYLAGSASLVSELTPVAILDVEHSAVGTLSDFDDDKIDVFDVKKIAQANDAHEFEVFMSLAESLLTEDHPYKTVVIDTLDVVNEMALDYYGIQYPSDGFAKWTATKDALTASGGLIDRMKAADFLSILVMHVQTDDDGKNYEFAWQGRSARSTLGQYPDIVMHVDRTYNKRKGEWSTEITTVPTGDGQAKNRFLSKIPPVMEGDITMKDIWTMLSTKEKK